MPRYDRKAIREWNADNKRAMRAYIAEPSACGNDEHRPRGNRPRIHIERDDAICAAYLAGERVDTIATRHKVTSKTVYRVARRAGIYRRPPK